MAKGGRPRILDEAKQREVCALLSAGASRAQAARYVGCAEMTLRREASRSKDFADRMRRAQATASLAPLQAMRNAAANHWRAAAWMLERADPESFGRKHPRHLGAKELRALRHDLIAIFNEEIEHPSLRERIAKRVKAAIDYAMRHAWDTHRTGREMRSAMEFFTRREDERAREIDAWDPVSRLLAEFDRPTRQSKKESPAEEIDREDHDGSETMSDDASSFVIGREKFCSKLEEFCECEEPNCPGMSDRDDSATAQNP